MTLFIKERFWSSLIIAVLTIVLIVLAVLQYRWSGEISDATVVRMRQNLQNSVFSFRTELDREFVSIGSSLYPEQFLGSRESFRDYAGQIAAWRRSAVHPWLVENVYVWNKASDGTWRTWKLDATKGDFLEADVPANLASLKLFLDSASDAERSLYLSRFRREEREEGEHLQDRVLSREFRRFDGRMMPWGILDDVPALVHPVFDHNQEQGPGARVGSEWIVLQLNMQAIEQHVLPELAERYFGTHTGSAFYVTVTQSDLGPILYSSNTKSADQEPFRAADASMYLFGPIGAGPRSEMSVQTSPRAEGSSEHKGPFPEHFVRTAGLIRINLAQTGSGGDGWRILVRHRDGSLENAVARLRTRNLFISFGVLFVLAITTAVVIVATHRAQRLARLQMQFVAGVSHELRTPLAVISSAADNIADGIVDNKHQLKRYGSVIKTQAKQLSGLVEQILLFASTSERRHRYHVRLLSVREVLEEALNLSSGLLQSQGVTVNLQTDDNLPYIEGDLNALSHCLQNLITNAIKYGGTEKWVGISGRREGEKVQITVEDHGKGIDPSEVPHIFEPFYRGREATEAQIHGTGLGLPIAKRIAEVFGGRLTVSSKPGEGSRFTLHLPIAAEAESAVPESMPEPHVEQQHIDG
jgi:signal transduction histidine kinase